MAARTNESYLSSGLSPVIRRSSWRHKGQAVVGTTDATHTLEQTLVLPKAMIIRLNRVTDAQAGLDKTGGNTDSSCFTEDIEREKSAVKNKLGNLALWAASELAREKSAVEREQMEGILPAPVDASRRAEQVAIIVEAAESGIVAVYGEKIVVDSDNGGEKQPSDIDASKKRDFSTACESPPGAKRQCTFKNELDSEEQHLRELWSQFDWDENKVLLGYQGQPWEKIFLPELKELARQMRLRQYSNANRAWIIEKLREEFGYYSRQYHVPPIHESANKESAERTLGNRTRRADLDEIDQMVQMSLKWKSQINDVGMLDCQREFLEENINRIDASIKLLMDGLV